MTLLTLLRGGSAAVRQQWDSSWEVHQLILQQWDSSWKVNDSSRPAVAQGWLSSWIVRTAYVPEAVSLQRRSRWRVFADPAAVAREWESAWRVLDSVGQSWDGAWLVKDVNAVAQEWDSEWMVRNLVRLASSPTWMVERRETDVCPVAQLNGINLTVIGPMDMGGMPTEHDLIRHYDGSLLMHDVRQGLHDRSVPIMLSDDDHINLKAQEDAIKAACVAGGTFVWQSVGPSGDVGPLTSDSFAPSPEPSFRHDKGREALYRSYATLSLRMWPS